MKLKHILLAAAGFFFLILGAAGAVLPILPTTPFVLLAAACFASNPRLHDRMMKIPFFREYISNYREGRGLPKRTVIQSLVFLWAMLLVSALYIRILWVAACLALVGAAVTIHILHIAKGKKN
ncbi:MAG: DUF454 domain-containing protein [Clostridia bacterium]|nr:DUF454 domain-containing protein [Clostridia bacterium]